MKKCHKTKIVAVILASVLLDLVLHTISTSYSTTPKNADISLVASILGTEITASLWAMFAFSGVAFVFLHIRNEIPGEGMKKGLRYGTAIALLWLFAMLEGVSLFGNAIKNEFVVGLCDAIPVFVLSILLSKLCTEKNVSDLPVTLILRQKIETVTIIAGIFVMGRYIAYLSGIIQSGNQTRPIQTVVWTLLMGIAIGLAFVLLDHNRSARSLIRWAVRFGFIIFGLNWGVFLVFMPLLFSGYTADVLLRITIDVSLVTIASYLALIARNEFIRSTKYSKA